VRRSYGTTLTILFTDTVSSTEVSVRLGPEAHALRRAHDRLLREQFDAHGGNIVKNRGDGFFVTFASAKGGVECAAAIQRAIEAEHSEGRYPDLAVRIGIHTGEPDLEDGDYFGVDVALADRIMSEASGGDVFVSEITYLLARSTTSMPFDSEGARALKGLPDPVPLYRLRWDTEPRHQHLSRFVGRAAERSLLVARLDAARQGHGGLVLISGDAGVGKTRLAHELCVEARDKGMLVLTGRAFDTEGLPPYHAVVDAVRVHLRGHGPEDLRAILQDDAGLLGKLAPDLPGTLADDVTAPTLTPEAERFRLFEAITRTLFRIVAATPGVLLLDDLHWADGATVHLLEHVARRVSAAPLLILATYRDVGLAESHPLSSLAYEAARASMGERVALAPLSRDDAASLAAHILGEPLPKEAADALYASAEGNPFFTEELVRQMHGDTDLTAHEAMRWDVPDSVRHVILRPLDRLNEQTRDLLTCCAALGRDLTLARLAAVTGATTDEVVEALDEALRAHVLREEGDGYAFAHPLISEAVYQSLRAPRRQRIHRTIASALEQLYEDEVGSHVQELAHHFLESAKGGIDVRKAVEYARRAAAQAANVYAYDAAAAYYRRAAEAVTSSGTRSAERCELLLLLGDMQTKAGDAATADATFHVAAEVARALDRADLLARAALGLGDVRRTWSVVDEGLITLLEDALAALDGGDSLLRSRLLARLTSAEYLTKPVAEMRARAMQATEMAQRLGDDETTVYVWRTARLFRHDQHDARERLRDARELEALARRTGDREAALYARHMQVEMLVELGDIHEADALIATFEQEAQALRQPFYLWLGAVYRAMRALMDGRWVDADELAQKAFALGRQAQTGNDLALQFLASQLFATRLEQGRLAELLPVIRDFARQNLAVRWRVVLAFALSESGEDDRAREEFDEIVTHQSVDVPDDLNQSMLLVFLADLCDRFSDVKRARPIYERLLPFEGRNVVVGSAVTTAGAASRLLGLLAGLLERWDDAERHYEDALAMNARIGSPPLVAWTRFNLASTLLRRSQPGDEERAERLLEEATATADELQMARLRRRAHILVERRVSLG
jgi:class 3 adenylate cyclase/tetratricopeptide (TPR) repeat protein